MRLSGVSGTSLAGERRRHLRWIALDDEEER
jgi:hypothetical protein